NLDKFRNAKIAWSTCCLPKTGGGLGLRSFAAWNKVLLLRFVWLLFSGRKSLWVTWHSHYHLHGKNLWALSETNHQSWAWKQILKLRHLALRFCKGVLNSGLKISFWYDVWTPLGQLLQYFGPTGPIALRIPLLASVADACSLTGWRLPSPQSQEALTLQIHLTTIPLPSLTLNDDFYEWRVEDSTVTTFSSATTWQALRPREEEKHWVDCLALGNLNPPVQLFRDWNELLSWIRISSNLSSSILRRLATHATIFHLWKQRNNAYHNSCCSCDLENDL
ncbi:hypothetical protein N665_0792s0030, partial [Sinapis alba]